MRATHYCLAHWHVRCTGERASERASTLHLAPCQNTPHPILNCLLTYADGCNERGADGAMEESDRAPDEEHERRQPQPQVAYGLGDAHGVDGRANETERSEHHRPQDDTDPHVFASGGADRAGRGGRRGAGRVESTKRGTNTILRRQKCE